jgi:tRNA U34 5-methylaminomethyl-2-thiouridine-forming methyltransferase MnmC
MRYMLTQDGSQSFFNENFQEAYHSKIGAYTEALEKHIRPSKILEILKKETETIKEINILDVCFGLAYNSGVAIEKIRELNSEVQINITALENDTGILKRIYCLEVPDSYIWVRDLLGNKLSKIEGEGLFEFDLIGIKLDLFIGDARQTVRELKTDFFDAIFFDPFSPKSCPELWTKEFIKDVADKAKPSSFISTYSSSRLAKEGFLAADCILHEGPKLNRRTGGVLAEKRSAKIR